jgi:hypothetical protein
MRGGPPATEVAWPLLGRILPPLINQGLFPDAPHMSHRRPVAVVASPPEPRWLTSRAGPREVQRISRPTFVNCSSAYRCRSSISIFS